MTNLTIQKEQSDLLMANLTDMQKKNQIQQQESDKALKLSKDNAYALEKLIDNLNKRTQKQFSKIKIVKGALNLE